MVWHHWDIQTQWILNSERSTGRFFKSEIHEIQMGFFPKKSSILIGCSIQKNIHFGVP